MSNWIKDLEKEEQAVIGYFRETHPAHKNADSFKDIKYQKLTPAECLDILRRFRNED